MTAKTYAQFDADVRAKIVERLNPAAREGFIAGKLTLDVIEFQGQGIHTMERQIATKRKEGIPVLQPELDNLAWAKQMASQPVIVIPDDLAA